MRRRHLPLLAALVATTQVVAACDRDTQTNPTPHVTAGSISQSPTGVGLAAATPFTFTATGFTSSSGEGLSYTWDFGDRTAPASGASVVHTYLIDWYVFKVTVTAAAASGASVQAELNGVRTRSADGMWGIRDASGRLVLARTILTQNEANLHGDDSSLNCRYDVRGSVSAPRSISLAYTRPSGDCRGRNLPESFTFSGLADDLVGSFAGVMEPGGLATLERCPFPAGCT